MGTRIGPYLSDKSQSVGIVEGHGPDKVISHANQTASLIKSETLALMSCFAVMVDMTMMMVYSYYICFIFFHNDAYVEIIGTDLVHTTVTVSQMIHLYIKCTWYIHSSFLFFYL